MAKGFIAEGSNCYHHLRIDKIRNFNDFRYLKCIGGRFFRDLKNPSGFRVEDYSITVRVDGYLVDYVDFELSEGDNIFVIGHLTNGNERVGETYRRYPLLIADCIYKEDFLKYFPRANIGER